MYRLPLHPAEAPRLYALYGPALAIAPLVFSVISTGLAIKGQMDQSSAAKAQAGYQAQVAKNNSILASRAARDALQRGSIAESNKRRETALLIGRQRASLAANGVQVDTGSALDITTDTAGIGELDALTIRDNARREAAGYTAQGSNFDAQAQLAKLGGQSDGLWGTAGTLTSGLTTVADKWYTLNKNGAFGGGSGLPANYAPQSSLGGAPGQY